ncbi:membrane protein insertase YidC [Thermovibrio ammonificans]
MEKGKFGTLIQSLILALLIVIGFQFFFHRGEEKKELQKPTSAKTYSLQDVPSSKRLGELVTVETPLYTAQFSTVNGKLVKLTVKKYNAQLVSPISKELGVYPLTTVAANPELSKVLVDLNTTPSAKELKVTKAPAKLTFTGKLPDGRVFKKVFTFYPNSYRIDFKAQLKGARLQTIVGPDIKVNEAHTSRMGHIGPVIETQEKVIRLKPEEIKGFMSFNNVLWAGEEDKYFLMAVKDTDFTATVEKVGPKDTLVRNFVGSGIFYGGPKELHQLEPLGMDSAIDFGIFGFLAKPLLKFFLFLHKFVPNWGLDIILFVLIIKILLHPLAHKSYVSMKKMQELAPKLEELKKRYGNDPQKLQEETMKLYQEMGVNPASGCLPMLLQIPIFFALYEIFLNAVELKGASFLWIPDLSQPDHTYILPVLMGLSMIVQQLLTPTTNKQQQKIFILMAVIFTVMFATFPAGLVLYWFTNNVITAIQNFIILKILEKKG